MYMITRGAKDYMQFAPSYTPPHILLMMRCLEESWYIRDLKVECEEILKDLLPLDIIRYCVLPFLEQK